MKINKKLAKDIFEGIQILTGDEVGPSGAAWQDVAETLGAKLLGLSCSLNDRDTKSIECLHELQDLFEHEFLTRFRRLGLL